MQIICASARLLNIYLCKSGLRSSGTSLTTQDIFYISQPEINQLATFYAPIIWASAQNDVKCLPLQKSVTER